ncbi:hypothetical protein VTK26DRAFT_4933 [Humicola hyalothermophila]
MEPCNSASQVTRRAVLGAASHQWAKSGVREPLPREAAGVASKRGVVATLGTQGKPHQNSFPPPFGIHAGNLRGWGTRPMRKGSHLVPCHERNRSQAANDIVRCIREELSPSPRPLVPVYMKNPVNLKNASPVASEDKPQEYVDTNVRNGVNIPSTVFGIPSPRQLPAILTPAKATNSISDMEPRWLTYTR